VPHLLVTGATGCIGRATVKRAIRSGWSVTGLARREAPPWWPSEARYVRAPVNDLAALARAAQDSEAIVHLASPVHQQVATHEEEARAWTETVDGTALAARVATECGARFILISTIGVYGNPPPSLSDERTRTGPTTAYGRAKLAAEERSRAEHANPLVLRCAVVYGPGDRGNMIRIIDAVDRGRAFIVGRGANRKSVLFSENLADRILACLAVGVTGTWCVADTPAPTQRELLQEIARAVSRPQPRSIPAGVAIGVATVLDVVDVLRGSRRPRWSSTIRTLLSESKVDGSALDRAISYSPRVSLDEGLSRTVKSLRLKSEAATRS